MTFEYLALLRGINVGGKNRILMKDLASLFTDAGANDVQTFIQSGNVLFNCPESLVPQVKAEIACRLDQTLTNSIPIVFRSRIELLSAIELNPYLTDTQDLKQLHVMFLREIPEDSRIGLLDPERSAPDRYSLVGKEIFLHVVGSFADTKVTNQYIDSRLKTVSTTRNWKTVTELARLMTGTRNG